MIIVSRQLGDYLPGGKFNIDSSPNFEKLKETSVNVSTTNIVSERDFGLGVKNQMQIPSLWKE